MAIRVQPLVGERQFRESANAVRACNDFLLSRKRGQGAIKELWQRYSAIKPDSGEQPPTRSWGTLWQWSQRFGWAERAEEYDAEQEAARDEFQREAREATWSALYGGGGSGAEFLVWLVEEHEDHKNLAQARLAARDIIRYVIGAEADEELGEDGPLDWDVYEERIVRYAKRYRQGDAEPGGGADLGGGELDEDL